MAVEGLPLYAICIWPTTHYRRKIVVTLVFALLQVIALIIMRQFARTSLLEKYPRSETDLFTSLDTVDIFEGLHERFWEVFALVQDPVKTSELQPDLNGHLGSTEYMPGEDIPDTGLKLKRTLEVKVFVASKFSTALPSLKLTKQDINRWKMAKRAAESYQQLRRSNYEIFRGEPFERRCTNMPSLQVVPKDLPLALGFSAATMVYGGLHALAWSAHFHSPIEQLLWRISSVIVMGGIPTFYAVLRFCCFAMIEIITVILFTKQLLFAVFSPIAIAYVLARLYLVVECFIQLSHLPAGVYEVPEWSAYFPHIA